jgi:hypothetical protein
MASSTSTTEIFDSGPARPRRRLPSSPRRLGAAGVALVAAAELVAILLSGTFREQTPTAVSFLETWIDALNERDARTVSSMSCDYVAAFKSVSSIESYLAETPQGRPIVADHAITGTRSTAVDGRAGVQIDLSYASGPGDGPGKARVFVRVRNDRDMCIESFAVW